MAMVDTAVDMVDTDMVDMVVTVLDTVVDTTVARDLPMLSQKQKPPLQLKPMPHQKLMPGTDADTVMEDMVDTGMAVMVLDTDVDTMAITLARDPLMPPQKPMPGTDVDTAMDTAVDTVMVDTDTANKKLIVPYLQRNINTKLCHYTTKPSDYTLPKTTPSLLIDKDIIKDR